MRGFMHDNEIREFNIDNQGMHIGQVFKNIAGILSGNLVYLGLNEIRRMSEWLNDDPEK